jgi:cell division protein FtsQ
MGYSKFSSKLNRLESIYKELEQRLLVLKYIDLNVEDRVIVKIDTKRGYGNG